MRIIPLPETEAATATAPVAVATGRVRIQPHLQMGCQLRCQVCGQVHVPARRFQRLEEARVWFAEVNEAHRWCGRQ